ncbi:hypothetical protein C7B76_02035 [filamentous cyanobacterium CCP2]|nr:hypothetical protein C7B76_02035 [filamentous cyanobacterium CCP2]
MHVTERGLRLSYFLFSTANATAAQNSVTADKCSLLSYDLCVLGNVQVRHEFENKKNLRHEFESVIFEENPRHEFEEFSVPSEG